MKMKSISQEEKRIGVNFLGDEIKGRYKIRWIETREGRRFGCSYNVMYVITTTPWVAGLSKWAKCSKLPMIIIN